MAAAPAGLRLTKDALDGLYARLNRREFVHPDPLEVLYGYEDPLDREVVGLVAASLAYGRVRSILNSVHYVLARMPSPRRFITESAPGEIGAAFAGFKHRFATGEQLAALLIGAGRLIKEHGSLNAAFAAHLRGAEPPSVECGVRSAECASPSLHTPHSALAPCPRPLR